MPNELLTCVAGTDFQQLLCLEAKQVLAHLNMIIHYKAGWSTLQVSIRNKTWHLNEVQNKGTRVVEGQPHASSQSLAAVKPQVTRPCQWSRLRARSDVEPTARPAAAGIATKAICAHAAEPIPCSGHVFGPLEFPSAIVCFSQAQRIYIYIYINTLTKKADSNSSIRREFLFNFLWLSNTIWFCSKYTKQYLCRWPNLRFSHLSHVQNVS